MASHNITVFIDCRVKPIEFNYFAIHVVGRGSKTMRMTAPDVLNVNALMVIKASL